jgi:hypothetical protein
MPHDRCRIPVDHDRGPVTHPLFSCVSSITCTPGYSYRDRGIVGADDRFYFGPAGEHDGVIVAPMTCQRGHYSTPVKPGTNFLGVIVGSALKACDGIYNAAYGIIDSIIGSGDDGGQC